MRIVADENIPLLDDFFAAFGDIHRFPGRSIDRTALADAEVLLVRSVTKVDRALLQGSQVKFVGTCTIGTDHLDLDYLSEAGIAWSSAPGCNARGVVDYVLGCLLALAETTGERLAQRRYGVVGAGQVGGRLVDVLQGLGWQVLVCDPPRQAREGGDFVDLQSILRECDVISLHTPLDADTRYLLGADELQELRPGAWLINAARGPVVDNAALKAHLQTSADLRVVLDVWEHEPQADPELAQLCHIATPHIAGYSLDGKLRGTAQIYQSYCQVSGQPVARSLDELLPHTWLQGLQLLGDADSEWALGAICRAVYDPRRDDAAFRRSLQGDAAQRRAAFDALRKHYPYRREIEGLPVTLVGEGDALVAQLRALGCELR